LGELSSPKKSRVTERGGEKERVAYAVPERVSIKGQKTCP